MKGNTTMKTVNVSGNFGKKTSSLLTAFSFVICYLLFVICSCEQPFKAGLGPVVDTRPPTVTLTHVENGDGTTSGVGDFVNGRALFKGTAEDDYKLDSVWLKVMNYPDPGRNAFYDWQKVMLKDGKWDCEINTNLFDDGDLILRIRAVDSVKKEAITDDLAFTVKNTPPEVSLGLPLIKVGDEDGDLRSKHLNYFPDNWNGELPSFVSYPRKLDAQGIIVGMIRDNKGVNTDNNAAEGKFMPQYRLWRVDEAADRIESWPPNAPPTEQEYPWKDFSLNGNLIEVGINSFTFSIDLIEEKITPERFYALQVRVQSVDSSEFEYPRNAWTGAAWSALPDNSKIENSYALIYLRLPPEPPQLELYQFENILGEGGVGAAAWRNGKYEDIPGVDKNGNHPYVNRTAVNKNGPFKLRVKASHSEGIRYAVVYWEKNDKSQKGRFIWDTASDDPWTGWNAEKVSAGSDYSEWGYNDPHSANEARKYSTRSYIFTWRDDGTDKVPLHDAAGNEYPAYLRGKSKIQTFKGNDADWANKLPARWPFMPELDDSYWEFTDALDQGTYNIEVWTATPSGTKNNTPLTCSVSIDRKPPDIVLNNIEGSISPVGSSSYTVNGVVRPKLLLSDSEPTDTGFRGAVDSYFQRTGGTSYGYEQRYILVAKADADAMDAYLDTTPWPPVPASPNDPLSIPDVTVWAHGPIFESQFLLKTSPIYPSDLSEKYLQDGPYVIYVLGRDNAFNTGRGVFAIDVDASTDIPRISPVAGNVDVDVDDPDISADWPASNAGKGFVISNGQGGRTVRNKFTANTAIRLRLSDDDSLDLGTMGSGARPAEPSGVRVQFLESKKISEAGCLLELDDDALKAAFGVQPVDERTGKRLAVKEKQGEITQQILLGLLKNNSKYDYLFGIVPADSSADKDRKKAAYNSLPSGIFRVTVSVADYNEPSIKLVMKSGDPNAEIARAMEEFWIVVDNDSPEAGITSPAAGGYISADQNVEISGFVSDLNGPIYVERFTVDPVRTNGTANVWVCARDAVEINRDTSITDSFAADFKAQVNLNNNSGTFTFTFEFRDRFGNARVSSVKYQVDQVPPTAGLTKTITTFERDEADVLLVGPQLAVDSVNKQRLANGVVDFKISATDNFKVTKVRWWLLPVDKGSASGGLVTTGDDVGYVSGFDAYPAGAALNSYGVYYDAVDGAYGEIDWLSSDPDKNRVIVDTTKLVTKNGEYRLHVIALDEAQNASGINADAIVQDFFILQEEDKPYFGAITPSATPLIPAVVDTPVTIQGMIFDDDGFAAAVLGPVEIWYSDTGAVADLTELESGDSLTGFVGPKTVRPAEITVTGNPGKTLTLKIDLGNTYYGFDLSTDGAKSYVIRAVDSIANKIKEDGKTETDTAKKAWRAKAYSFILDTKKPVVDITDPKNESIYGNNSAQVNFEIKGFLNDANLAKNDDNHYYFTYWLDGWTGTKDFDLATAGTTVSVAGDQVSFTIPASVVASEILKFVNSDPQYPVTEGPHVLTFTVKDLSDKEGTDSLTFTLDNTPPTFSLNGINKRSLPNDSSDADFNAIGGGFWTPTDAAARGAKHDWLYNKANSPGRNVMISYSSRPTISGMFTDEVSDIDTSTFKYIIDNDGTERTANVEWQGSGKMARWEITLPTTLADGAHTIQLKIADTSGNPFNDGLHYVFILDSAAPINAIDANSHSVIGFTGNIDNAFSATGKIFTLTGSATDANLKELGLKIVEQATGKSVYPDPADPNKYSIISTGTWTYGSPEQFAWTWDLTTTVYKDLVRVGFAEHKTYDIVTEASDWYGTKSEKAIWSFMVTTDPPKVGFDGGLKTYDKNSHTPSEFGSLDSNGAYVKGAYHNEISTNVHEIRGNVIDSYSPITELQYQLEKWDYGTGTWAVDAAWGDLQSLAGNTSLQVNWILDIEGKDQGFYRIQVRAKNSAYNENASSYNPGAPGNPVISDYVYFFYDDSNGPSFDPSVEKYYTTRYNSSGTLTFTGTAPGNVNDPNRIRQMKVTTTVNLIAGGTSTRSATWAPANLNQPASLAWSLSLTGLTASTVKDGNYSLEFTAIDMAGNKNTIIVPFILDSTVPGGEVSEPAKEPRTGFPEASVVVLGGEVSYISGRTSDTGTVSSAESGVAGVWYHLGFIDGSTTPAWPTAAGLAAALGITSDSGTKANNDIFDNAANAATGNAWFKLGGAQTPTGFTVTNANIYDWRIKVWGDDPDGNPATDDGNGFKVYANTITIKGRTYNTGTLWLTQRVSQTDAGRAGIFRMPLWVRVADTAGNVNYFCRDIWIYPDADIPTTSIINPQDGAKNSPRGGAIGADGTATNNVSVYAVIYRVWADDKQDPAAAVDGSSHLVTLSDAQNIEEGRGQDGWNDMKTILTAKGISTNGWYLANSLVGWGSPNVPWTFTFNTNQEITGNIGAWGFDGGSGKKDTIRVRLEVIVFKGDAVPQRISINSEAGGTDAAPLPFIKTFFMSEDAPEILNPRVSIVEYGTGTSLETYAGRVVRRGRFAVEADLKANGTGKTISNISVRLKDEVSNATDWRPVWDSGTSVTAPAGITLTATPTATAHIRFVLDSAASSAPAGVWWLRNGGWRSGGGTYNIEIRIRDSGSPAGEAFQTFEIGIDNFAPVADKHPTHLTPGKVAGSSVPFLGRALDYRGNVGAFTPPDRKVQKVIAWFTKAGDYVNYMTGQRLASVTTASVSAYQGREARAGTWTNPTDVPTNPKNVTLTSEGSASAKSYPTDLTAGWAIEISQGTAVPGSGMSWLPNDGDDADITWTFNVDTTVLPDGKINLNYLVYDDAGNITFYSQDDIVVMNKYPFIDRVRLHTDNRGIGAVFTTHEDTDDAVSEYRVPDDLSAGYLNTGFISKNKVIGFELRTLYGNAPLNYRLQYVTRKQVALTGANLGAMIEIAKKARNPSYNIPAAALTGSSFTGTEANLFTIKQFGAYGSEISDAWRNIGVVTEKPKVGAHFVFTAESMTGLRPLEPTDTGDRETQVWAYTPVVSRPNLTGVTDNDSVGPDDNYTDGFSRLGFKDTATGNTYFDVNNPTTRIGQKNGSHPGGVGGTDNANDTAFFLIKVWDSVVDPGNEYDQLYDAIVVGMNVYLSDTTSPMVRLYDLNPYTETAVSGNNIGNSIDTTIRNAANPQGVGRNILRGGLYNINTNTDLVKSGHIEPRNNTTALKPPFNNPGAVEEELGSFDRYTDKNAENFWDGGNSDLPAASLKVADTNANTNFTIDQVSGKIILRGIAWDDQLIRNIRIKIGTDDGTAGLTILQLDTNTSSTTYRKMVAPTGVQAWASETLHWKNGHTVEWAYVWDTELKPSRNANVTLPANGAQNVEIQVFVSDYLGSSGAGLAAPQYTVTQEDVAANANKPISDKTKIFHNRVNVNIVPYIVGFERKKPDFATTRSLQGWYSFYRGESDIYALGYNLKGSGQTTMSINTTASNNYALTMETSANQGTAGNLHPTSKTDYTRFLNHIKFTVPDNNTELSGEIVLTANNGANAAALNRSTANDTKSWNREYWKNTNGSELWINRPHAHIWRSTETATVPTTYFAGSAGLDSPSMKLIYTTGTTTARGTGNGSLPSVGNGTAGTAGGSGTLIGAWSAYGAASVYMALNAGTTTRNAIENFNSEPFSKADLGFYNGGNAGGSAYSILYDWEQDGQSSVQLKSSLDSNTSRGMFEYEVRPRPNQRWQNLRVATSTNTNYVSVFDGYNHTLRYVRGNAAGTRGNAIVLDGNSGSNTTAADGQNITNLPIANITALSSGSKGSYTVTTTLGAAANAGQFNAIDYDGTGPIIAYYDGNTVRLAMGRAADPTTAANQWYRRNLLPTNHPLFNNSGQYISMKVDSTRTISVGGNNEATIHLAFFNSRLSTVVYAVGSRSTEFRAYTIDRVVAGGVWTNVSVDSSGNPYIVYGDLSRSRLRDGVRVAYRDSTLFTKVLNDTVNTSEAITGWEAVTVPSNYTVNEDRLCIEVWPPVNRYTNTAGATPSNHPNGDLWNWDIAVGYPSDLFRLAYYRKATYKNY
jgi:hypothetical protein